MEKYGERAREREKEIVTKENQENQKLKEEAMKNSLEKKCMPTVSYLNYI